MSSYSILMENSGQTKSLEYPGNKIELGIALKKKVLIQYIKQNTCRR